MNTLNNIKDEVTDSAEMYRTLMSEFCQVIPRKTYGDVRRLYTLAWAVIGLLMSKSISLSSWGEVVIGRAKQAASHRRRFARWMNNVKIDAISFYTPLLMYQLKQWSAETRFRIALDTSVLPRGLVLIRIALIYRGRAMPIVWKVIAHNSATISYETYKPLQERVLELMPTSAMLELSADRGFFHTELIEFCRQHGWHYRLRATGDTLIRLRNRSVRNLRQLCPPRGVARFYHDVYVTGINLGPLHIALANPAHTLDEDPWYVVSDEITDLHTLDDYALRFDIEESFLDDKSGGFHVEDSRLDGPEAWERLFLVLAIASLHLTSVGVAVVDDGKRRWVDTHWDRGMSYLKIGWQWVRQQFRKNWPRFAPFFLPDVPDPEIAIASRRQAAIPGLRFSIEFNPP
jgi:hypothetical protein